MNEPKVKPAPSVLDGMPMSIVKAWERDFDSDGRRRPKCSREDHAAGWMACLQAHWLKGRKRRPPEPPDGYVPDEQPSPEASGQDDRGGYPDERQARPPIEADGRALESIGVA